MPWHKPLPLDLVTTDLRQRLTKLGARHKRLRADLDAVREELQPLIVEATRAGMAQIDLVALTDYTRDRIRVICREAGVEPLKQGRRKASPKRPTAITTED